MARSIPRAPALTALALAVALTAACAPTAPVEPTPTPAAPVVAVEPTPEPDETPGPAPEPAPEPKGPVYTLEDGTKVEIDPDAKKLPKKVRKDLAKKASSAAEGGPSQWGNMIRNAETATGRKAIVVMSVEIEPEGKPHGRYWTVAASPEAIHPPVTTKDEAVSIAEAHVAAQSDPSDWVIVVSSQ